MVKSLTAFSLAIACSFSAQASDVSSYPDHAVSVIVPFSPGGNVDIVARLINHKLEQELGESFVVLNVPGASGAIGASQAARAKPDGYTLLANSSAHVIAPSLVANLSYDVIEDFIPLSQITQVPMVLLVSSELPVDNLEQFVDWAKAQPDGLDYATYMGSAGHLAGELLKGEAKVQMNLIPYKSGATMVSDVMSNRVPAMFDGLFAAATSLKSGKVKALAITAEERSDFLPDIPTFKELGYGNVNAETWHGYWAPKGTPAPIIEKLQVAISKAVAEPDIQQRILDLGGKAIGSSSAEFTEFTKNEHDRWKSLLEKAGVKPQ